VGVDVEIPKSYDFDMDIDFTHIPKISVGFDPVTLDFRLPKISVGFDPFEFKPLEIKPLEIKPMDVSVRLTEIPSTRSHLPANYTVGVSVLGLQLFAIRLCGEAQVITEPYKPNPCEHCG